MLLAVLSGFIFAGALAFLGKSIFDKSKWLFIALPFGLFAYFSTFLGGFSVQAPFDFFYEWVPSLGVNLSFHLDGLSLLFALLITGIGALVFLYSSYYLKNDEQLKRFYGYLTIFMGAMLGVVLSNNLISLFVFWELTSISSFFLISYKNNDRASRKAAMTALAITGLGGMALLAFAVLAGGLMGTYEITEMLNSAEVFHESSFATLLFVLLIVAAFTKSAQFPLHFWLPGAMKAPTPVSTYLHSATMVKAGIYLLLRFSTYFSGSELWQNTLITFGGVTMVYAAFQTLFRTDLKSILAYSTISALGVLVFLIGIGTGYAITAALIFIIVHALYKAALFLITGIIDHQTGTRNISKLSGLYKFMIPVAIAGFIAAISSAGVPSTIGFIGKDLIYEATLHADRSSTLFTILAITTNCLLVFAGFIVGIKPFIGKRSNDAKPVKAPSAVLWIPTVILAVFSLAFGLFPQFIGHVFITPAVEQLGVLHAPEVKLWHGWNFVLLLSLVTLALGALLFFLWKKYQQKENWMDNFEKISPQKIALHFANFSERMSYSFTSVIQNGYLRNYVLVLVVIFTTVLAYHVFTSPLNFIHWNELLAIHWNDLAVIGTMLVAIMLSVFTPSRLVAVASLGVVGYAMCFIFVFYSAPDLAMTQFTIDTLTVILFVLVLYRLPKYLRMSNFANRIRDGILALSLGAMVAMLILEVLNEKATKSLSTFYAENAYVLAKGKNIVNVILVDFRGFDTFIEIIVLTIAAIGVFGLLKLYLRRNEK